MYLENDEALDEDDENKRSPSDILSGVKIPTHNMLSEISEEDDLSMLSERNNGINSPAKKSRKASKHPS